MGAVNYFTSDYITMGLRPYDSWELEKDHEFMGEIQNEVDEYGGTVENAIRDYIQSCYESDLTLKIIIPLRWTVGKIGGTQQGNNRNKAISNCLRRFGFGAVFAGVVYRVQRLYRHY